MPYSNDTIKLFVSVAATYYKADKKPPLQAWLNDARNCRRLFEYRNIATSSGVASSVQFLFHLKGSDNSRKLAKGSTHADIISHQKTAGAYPIY